MKRIMKYLFIPVLATLTMTAAMADDIPTINPTATYITDEGDIQSNDTTASAPITGRFEANAENVGAYTATYQWIFYLEGEADDPYLTRYEEDTEYTFTTAGSHRIVLYATFVNGSDTVAYTSDYWAENDPIKITVSESKLEMPNAFSPNGDGVNDIYKAKEGYRSLTEFHAYIYNRWGQLIYEWTDPAGGWDGTYHGKDVKQGVYFCLVKAKGADGIVYNIKRDVNLLRGYTEAGSTVSE